MCYRNATASWSGFSHQGQVGLLVAIRKMRENGINLAIHYLEYEKKEDVSICKRENGNEEYLSVHQVKAYYSQGHLINSYKSVLRGRTEYQRGPNGKLAKDADGNKQPTGNFIGGDWCNGDNYLHSVEAIGDWTDANVAQIGNPHNVKRYQYSNGVFHCNTIDIAAFIKTELLAILNNDQNRVNIAHLKLTYLLDEKIRSEHSKGEKALFDISFSLQELQDTINDESEFQANHVSNLRNAFYYEYQERIRISDYDEEHVDEVTKKIIDPIYHLSDNDFIAFLRRLHFDVNPSMPVANNFMLNPHGVRYVFFQTLLEILLILPVYEDHYVLYSKNGQAEKFLLTAISNIPGEEKTVVENILRNTELLNILWDQHALVNQNIEGSLISHNPSIMNAGTAEEQKGKFMSFSEKTRFIKVDDAKNILNQ